MIYMISNLNELVKASQNSVVEFVHFTHESYNACSGELTISVDGNIVHLGRCLRSGGSVWFDDNWDEHVESGPWTFRTIFELPDNLKCLEDEILKVVNDNISWGCCGGCV